MLRVHLDETDLPLTPAENQKLVELPFGEGDFFSYVSISSKADEKALITYLRRFTSKLPSEYGSVHIAIHGTPMRLEKDATKEVDPWAPVGPSAGKSKARKNSK